MPLTSDERATIRAILGYPAVETAGAISFGSIIPIQTLFLVESAMDRVREDGLARVRELMERCTCIELEMFNSLKQLRADRIGNMELRKDAIDAMEGEYYRHAARLADMLGVPFYPLSARFKAGGGVSSGSVPVRS